jgi:hypothetical protein
MKKIIILTLILIANLSCAQKKNDSMGKEKLLNLYKEVKMYDYNPRYWIDIQGTNCTYEILLNDMPIVSYFKKIDMSSSSIPLNTRILRKGEQKLDLIIYPTLDNNYLPKLGLDEKSKLLIKVSYGEFGKEKAKDYMKILSFTTPEFQNGLPIFKTSLIFESIVPYELDGWLNGVDLSKENQEILKQEVEKKYNEIMNLYENKDINTLSDEYYGREKEIAQSLFFNEKSYSEELLTGLIEDVNKDIVFKLENYNMKILGNGKVVALIRNDIKYRGMSALFRKAENKYYSYSLFLYRPKEGAPLEVIR